MIESAERELFEAFISRLWGEDVKWTTRVDGVIEPRGWAKEWSAWLARAEVATPVTYPPGPPVNR